MNNNKLIYTSDCCGAKIFGVNICSDCGEKCTPIEEKSLFEIMAEKFKPKC